MGQACSRASDFAGGGGTNRRRRRRCGTARQLDQLAQDASASISRAARRHAGDGPQTNDPRPARDRAADREHPPLRRGSVAGAQRRADALLQSSGRRTYRLQVAREEKPYVLPEGEEQALNARRVETLAWSRCTPRARHADSRVRRGRRPEPHARPPPLSAIPTGGCVQRRWRPYGVLEGVADVWRPVATPSSATGWRSTGCAHPGRDAADQPATSSTATSSRR